MTDDRDRLGSSGVFKAIVAGARKFKRAVTGGDDELSAELHEFADRIARAFIGNKFEDLHALGTEGFQHRTGRAQFAASWRDAVKGRLPLTGFSVADAGPIEIGFIPGLEEVPQEQFLAFVRITFSSPNVSLDDERAFVVGAVLLDEGGLTRIGALHTE